MSEQQRHEMVLEITHPSGAEEWYCPTCGRRMRITWQPWKKVVLEPGDLHAAHGGSKGILKIGPLQFNMEGKYGSLSGKEPSLEDPYLASWVGWLEKMNWDDLWNEDRGSRANS